MELCDCKLDNNFLSNVLHIWEESVLKDMGEGSVLTPEKMQNPYFWPNMGLQ